MNYIDLLKKEKEKYDDLIIREINLNNINIYVIGIETLCSTNDINLFLLKNITYLNTIKTTNLTNYLYNNLPVMSIEILNDYNILLNRLFDGFSIILIYNNILSIETRKDLSRGINDANYEKTIVGPKDAFTELYNANLGLIRRRIKKDLNVITYNIGKYSKTKIGLLYINNICKKNIVNSIDKKLKSINTSGILDVNVLKKYLNTGNSLFPTLKTTERPDLASMSLLEGKCIIIVDNSPEVLILPTFFIDYFHASDDYYQKKINISFIRIIRLIAFIIAIFLPAIYIAMITHNPDTIPINLLLSFQKQRANVPFPAFIEAILMIITFEILRESDVRIPSTMGSAISILGGLVLGEAAVSAGIVSPIMIIVVALSAISGMLIQSIEAVNSIRFYRFILIILASFLGYFGIFIGTLMLFTSLSSTKSLDKDFLYPFAPINLEEQKDGFLRLNNKNKRNPLLSRNKNRGTL